MQQSTEPFNPYQSGDFIKDKDGINIAYTGPIYEIRYPLKLGLNDAMSILLEWSGLGYRHIEGIWNEGKLAVKVWGEIPESTKNILPKADVTIELTKEKGLEVPFDRLDDFR